MDDSAVVAVISVDETTSTLLARTARVVPLPWPTTTVEGFENPVPVIVRDVLPPTEPVFGLTLVTVGAAPTGV